MSRWKNKIGKAVLAVAFLTTTMVAGTATTASAAVPQANLDLAVKSAILVEASTGKILYQNNPDVPLPPASMTKMMTEYLVMEAIKENKIKWDQKVKVSDYAFYIAKKSDSSGVYLNSGEEFTVGDLYQAMAIVSANDATVLLAETVGGSEPNFVVEMNKKAQELGMKNTHFLTSSGLPASELGPYAPADTSNDNVMTARDAAILARALIRDYPDALKYSQIPRLTFRPGQKNELKKANYNWMLKGLPAEYPGADGLKTGSTEQAKYCFTGTAQRDGMRLISVVMGAETEMKRFAETKKLFDYGFSNFKLTKKQAANTPVAGFESVPVKKGVELNVPAVPASDVTVLTKVGEEGQFKPKVTVQDLTAPVKKGQVIGKVMYQAADAVEADYLQPADFQKGGIDLVAANDVEEASWIRLFFRSIGTFFSNLFSSIIGK
ncbi:D-alanyl-D-alanine carboxypeptidase family protein [Brevibacillus fluminis]|uniref:D-alanyl-D-alanine carboxypeptidase family protein n=1 Tax=Brevibacillus fluminis TaxID=511487 RepID=UPI003F8C579C